MWHWWLFMFVLIGLALLVDVPRDESITSTFSLLWLSLILLCHVQATSMLGLLVGWCVCICEYETIFGYCEFFCVCVYCVVSLCVCTWSLLSMNVACLEPKIGKSLEVQNWNVVYWILHYELSWWPLLNDFEMW